MACADLVKESIAPSRDEAYACGKLLRWYKGLSPQMLMASAIRGVSPAGKNFPQSSKCMRSPKVELALKRAYSPGTSLIAMVPLRAQYISMSRASGSLWFRVNTRFSVHRRNESTVIQLSFQQT